MMSDELFQALFECLKILYHTSLHIPEQGTQLIYKARKLDDEREEFHIIINRKGHLNPDYLTYQLNSRHGKLVRIDMNGQPHENSETGVIETPHVHIFDSKHDNGRKAIPLDQLTDTHLIISIVHSLKFFLEYNNIRTEGIQFPMF